MREVPGEELIGKWGVVGDIEDEGELDDESCTSMYFPPFGGPLLTVSENDNDVPPLVGNDAAKSQVVLGDDASGGIRMSAADVDMPSTDDVEGV